MADTTKLANLIAAATQLGLEITAELLRISQQTGQTDAEILAEIEPELAANAALAEEHLAEYRKLIAERTKPV